MSGPTTRGLNSMLSRYASKRFVFGLALAYLMVFVVWREVDQAIATEMAAMIDTGILAKEVLWVRVELAAWTILGLLTLGAAHAISLGLQNFRSGEAHTKVTDTAN